MGVIKKVTPSSQWCVDTYVAKISQPLRELLTSKHSWTWGPDQQSAFSNIKWPRKSPANKELVPYWRVRASLSICNNLLLYNDCIVVPSALQAATLQCLHEGHQSIQRCHMRARISVWWSNISKQIEQMITNCQTCTKDVPRMLSTIKSQDANTPTRVPMASDWI